MDQYEELELIGKGTYGKVFRVRSRADGEVYVVKKVQFDGTPQTEAEAALREGQVLSLLRHPHIVPYKEFFKHPDGDLCLVMAYCEGGDLFRHIRELRRHGSTVPEPQVWQWLVQLLLSLSYIHGKRILHRDVKTQNIFLSEGKVLLGDFGLAKQLQRTFEMARTPIGTPYYMAPEIYEEQPYSFKSDVWALGCVMYEMMTGRAAFAADNLSKVVLRVIRGQYDPLPESYSSSLRTVVTSMLCKEVAARPDANTLLTVPAVVPHVQSYLESLTAEGPAGWATWRMKLPLAAMVQMSEALEAAGAPLPGRNSQPPSNRPSYNGGVAHQPSAVPERPAAADGAAPDVARPAARPPSPLDRPPSAPRTPEPRAASPPAAADGAAAGGGGGADRGGQVVRLPPLPGGKLPPLRTPYGLATPFMGGALQPAQPQPQPQPHYAELQMLAHQMLAIRTSQCGNGNGNSNNGALPPPPLAARPLSGGARPLSGGGGARPESAGRAAGSRPGSGGAAAAAAPGMLSPRGAVVAAAAAAVISPRGSRPGSGGASVAPLTLAPAAAAAEPGGGHVPEEVRALDRTLIKTLEIARKAAEGAAADGGAPSPRGGGGGGAIDEAALSAALPQGGFGFGGGGAHAGTAAAAAGGRPSALEMRRESSCSDLTLPPIQPRRPPSASAAGASALACPSPSAKNAVAWAWASGVAAAPPSGPDQPHAHGQQQLQHGQPRAYQHQGSGGGGGGGGSRLSAVHPQHPLAWPGTPDPPGTQAGHAVHPGRAAPYEEADEGYVSLSGVTLHAVSLSARRANLQRYCTERLGPELAAEVMQAVAAAQRAARGPRGDVDGACSALGRRLDGLLGPRGREGEALRSELGPLIEELALLHC